ncbi:ABC transporter permease [Chondrinema litorale]|uniref:ABC transporter permease n=1 Tax=Chondrinema litorale TaxID=2994555 RepID=UPI00254338EF|nr:ABC transporter permease [Chondrinema litorale]UZR97990.1 ABC transporter permease [Chondrinema litorale]
MLQHYFKISLRHLWNNKFFSLINITGLSVAMAAAFFIFRYVSNEWSYDKFHKNADALYRVNMSFNSEKEETSASARVSPIVGTLLKENEAAVENISRMVILGPDGIVSYKDNAASIRNLFLADDQFFKLFSFELAEGNQAEVLSKPFTIVISESVANQLYGDTSPIGKTIEINASNLDGSAEFTVSGVFKDFPQNTHIKPGVLIAYSTLFEFVGHRFDESWQWNETYTYVKLKENSVISDVEKGLNQFAAGANQEMWDEQKMSWKYSLQAITDIHLTQGISHESEAVSSKSNLWFLSGIAAFLLIIAYINFVNLTIVKSLKRLKEVGVRKVSGANRIQLFVQFLLDSAITNLLAFIMAIVLLTSLNELLESYFDINTTNLVFNNYSFPIFCFAFFILLLLSCSLYLGVIISAFKPTTIFKGKITEGTSSLSFKNGLIVLQFAVSTLFLIATFLVYRQVNFMQESDTGMDLEKIVIINTPKVFHYKYDNSFEQFQNEATKLAGVVSVTGTASVPGESVFMYNSQVEIDSRSVEGVFKSLPITKGFFDQYQISLLAGKDFTTPSRDWSIVNETAMKAFGYDKPEDIVGVRTSLGQIMGVVEDYHHESLKTEITPTVFFYGDPLNYYSVKLKGNSISAIMEQTEYVYKSLFPDSPFNYFFVDEFYNKQYKSERQFSRLFAFFAALVTFISCIGFLALTSYAVQQRTKEIGIRKTFGASNWQILYMLNRRFMKFILIAVVAAIPVANYLLSEWLNGFAYRIELNWLYFFIPCLLVIIIALLAVSSQSVRAASTNPASSMREE